MKKTAALFVTAIALATLAGCASSKKEAAADTAAAPKQANMGIVNTKCPMMLSHPAGTKVTVDYNGQKVGLCCAGCVGGWNKLTAEQKAEKLKAAM
jgi:hypothetical protein